MPLPLENTPVIPQPEAPVVPNVVYAPAIIIKSEIKDNELVTSAVISLKGAKVDETGKWSIATSETKTVSLADVTDLPEDVMELAPDIQQIFTQIVGLVGKLNNIRKLV